MTKPLITHDRTASRHLKPGRILLAAALSFALTGLAAGYASAQDATYSADDVTRHFKQLKTRSLKPTGGTRALCIGTRDECNPDAAKTEGGQVAVTPETSANGNTQQNAEALVADPETKAIGEGFNLLVSFEYASARLSPSARVNLREFAKGIADPDLSSAVFVIEGHTDGIGSAPYNQRLSEDRASAVTEFLVSLGVGRDRLKTVGYGKTRPKVADVNDPSNRRVESKLVLE
ncbi:OmpA family protein [Roseibium marinum]|uniref:Outer membrane protein OmpA-like peptidoglycan-associated protein n=1 Tax=Roseibium marinum TaxID=281252 RepID=A0A2S3UP43_9HYPH|nr:OmpA family protein [Roseibium marinum]POF29259.1 outer membrane protein OmpA-like peptidoglycan-associated protein [Roseibium marinum]